MNKLTEQICKVSLELPEYERKQIISILIASMLTKMSDDDAKKTYNKLISELKKP